MKISDLIGKLGDYNPEAYVYVRGDDGHIFPLSISYGVYEGEGVTKEDAATVLLEPGEYGDIDKPRKDMT